jgi:hypothetical protein
MAAAPFQPTITDKNAAVSAFPAARRVRSPEATLLPLRERRPEAPSAGPFHDPSTAD